jgi:RimJ/RimL family protein N-acetyltransferase
VDLPLTGGSLAALSEEDWPIEHALSRDAEVIRWTFYPSSMTETQSRERCRSFVSRAREGRSFRWVICTGDGVRAGTCGAAPRGDSVDLFYALLSEHRGRGLATDAVGALARSASRLSLTPQLAIEPENSASMRVAIRAGFALRGERREADGVLVQIWKIPVKT